MRHTDDGAGGPSSSRGAQRRGDLAPSVIARRVAPWRSRTGRHREARSAVAISHRRHRSA
ncbi:MAG: hypothetical protein U5K38_13585 [Woeseiaceae bacterium]|nr:hypothetical protein [Woeseiaceae bacterium]